MFGNHYRKESGAIVIDGRHVASTRQCVHCGSHEQILAESGRKRGWCINCNGFLCGKKKCFACIPYEAKIEYEEAIYGNQKTIIKKLLNKYPDIITL